MTVKKLSFYLVDVDITLRTDRHPLCQFLEKNTLNSKVNNLAVEIELYCKIKFEYIKSIQKHICKYYQLIG